MKPILPTLREKKRYIVFEVITPSPAAQGDALAAIKDAARSLLGTATLGKAGLRPIEAWNKDVQRGVIRVNRRYLDHARATLCCVQKIAAQRAIVHSVSASGSLKKALTHLAG